MRQLTFAMNVSLDGYVAAPGDELGWSVPCDELFQWWSDRVGATDLALYGRRMWQTMSAHWPTADQQPGAAPAEIEYARRWRDMPKFVFSSTIRPVDRSTGPGDGNTRPADRSTGPGDGNTRSADRSTEPGDRTSLPGNTNAHLVTGDAVAEITRLKAEDGGPMDICGATLAGAAMRAGLIDEYILATAPVLIGGGTPFFTALDRWVDLTLKETRTFSNGVVLTRYATKR